MGHLAISYGPPGHFSQPRQARAFARRLFLEANFLELRQGEVRRMHLLGNSVNKPACAAQ
jgi:hypothetical protein